MLSHFVDFFRVDQAAKLPLAQAWRVRLCNQAAAILMLATLAVACIGYVWIGTRLLLALGALLLVVQWGVVHLNREGFHRAARLGFCLCNSLLLYICSNLLGERSGFLLFYLVGLVACLTLFTPQEKGFKGVALAWLLEHRGCPARGHALAGGSLCRFRVWCLMGDAFAGNRVVTARNPVPGA